MREGGALRGHDTRESTGRNRSDVLDADGVPHENASFRIQSRFFEPRLELYKNARAEFANVFPACAQIGVFHSVKSPRMLGNSVPPCPGGPVSGADPCERVRYQAVTAKQHDVHIEQLAHLFRHYTGQALATGTEFRLNGKDCGPESDLLRIDVFGRAIGHGLQVREGVDQRRSADGHTGGSLNALNVCILPGFVMHKFDDDVDVRSVVYGLRKLRGDRDEERHLVFVELITNLLPGHEHAENLVIVDQRSTEKGIERLPACLSGGSVARVSRCIVEDYQLPALADQAQKAGLRP